MDFENALNIVLILGVICGTGCILYFTYYFVETLKSVKTLSENLNELTDNIKSKVELKALSFIPKLVSVLINKFITKKGGVKS